MVFKIVETVKSEMQEEEFRFNVLSENDGIELHLTDYVIKAAGSGPRRWSNIGDDGTYLKRKSITIPASVIDSAIQKISSSISRHIT